MMTAEQFRKICDTAEGYIDLGLLDDAAQLLEDLPPNLKVTKEVIVLHMTILVKSGQPLKASYLAENLSLGDPDNVGLMLEVAHLRLDAGEATEAIKWLRDVEAKCHSSAVFHHLRDRCYAKLGDWEACRSSLKEAHTIDPELKWKSLEDPAFDTIYGAESCPNRMSFSLPSKMPKKL
jgi:predicted Zn-dependent protease